MKIIIINVILILELIFMNYIFDLIHLTNFTIKYIIMFIIIMISVKLLFEFSIRLKIIKKKYNIK